MFSTTLMLIGANTISSPAESKQYSAEAQQGMFPLKINIEKQTKKQIQIKQKRKLVGDLNYRPK
jgi:hypothetical protein